MWRTYNLYDLSAHARHRTTNMGWKRSPTQRVLQMLNLDRAGIVPPLASGRCALAYEKRKHVRHVSVCKYIIS